MTKAATPRCKLKLYKKTVRIYWSLVLSESCISRLSITTTFSYFCIHSRHHQLTDWILIQKGEPNPFTAHFSFHSPKDDRLFKKDDRLLSKTPSCFFKTRSSFFYRICLVIYANRCLNLQIKKITSSDTSSALHLTDFQRWVPIV